MSKYHITAYVVRCEGVPAASFCGFNSKFGEDMELQTTLKGSGQVTVSYGNSWKVGTVDVKLNGEVKGSAGPKKILESVTLAFSPGDVLTIGEHNTAILVVNKVTFDCGPAPTPSPPRPPPTPPPTPPTPKPIRVRVFLLAGQSNMVGVGIADNLAQSDKAPENVWARYDQEYFTRHGLKHCLGSTLEEPIPCKAHKPRGKLRPGFGWDQEYLGLYGQRSEAFGPEIGIGKVLGAKFEEPVLLVKVAWGGKNLYCNFRPPSSGKLSGPLQKDCDQDANDSVQNDKSSKTPGYFYRRLKAKWHALLTERTDVLDGPVELEFTGTVGLNSTIPVASGNPGAMCPASHQGCHWCLELSEIHGGLDARTRVILTAYVNLDKEQQMFACRYVLVPRLG